MAASAMLAVACPAAAQTGNNDAGRYDPAGIDAVTPFEREVKALLGETEFSHARATALLRSLNSLERKIARLLP